MKIILNLFIALVFIGYGSMASASDDVCWKNPITGMVCCAAPGGETTLCHTDPEPAPEPES